MHGAMVPSVMPHMMPPLPHVPQVVPLVPSLPCMVGVVPLVVPSLVLGILKVREYN